MVSGYEVWINGYYHMSGGIRALHVLRDELKKRGQNAWMAYEKHDPDAIGVYPEIVPANPENYAKCVRWLLNTAEVPPDPTWAWEKNMGSDDLLTVNIIETELFKPASNMRSGTAFWVGKGVKDERFIPNNCVEIHRGNYTSRHEVAELLRSINYLISFDPFTAMNLEALMCGTPVLIRGDHPRMTRQQILDHGWTPFGIAFSMEELEEARLEVHLARDHYLSLLPIFDQRIDAFVQKSLQIYG
jgi:hypothetical protein